MKAELVEMTDVLLGKVHPPIDVGVTTMMEVANAYYARATEMEMALLEAEQSGQITKGSVAYRFRTGQLRKFVELSKSCQELGSRRLTALQVLIDEGG